LPDCRKVLLKMPWPQKGTKSAKGKADWDIPKSLALAED
jgi:hypothetical protein